MPSVCRPVAASTLTTGPGPRLIGGLARGHNTRRPEMRAHTITTRIGRRLRLARRWRSHSRRSSSRSPEPRYLKAHRHQAHHRLPATASRRPSWVRRAATSGPEGTDIHQGFAVNLVGTPGPEVIVGRGGDDILGDAAGDDVICGGDGRGAIFGGRGNDTLFGEAGKDALGDRHGNDTLLGGPGGDLSRPARATTPCSARRARTRSLGGGQGPLRGRPGQGHRPPGASLPGTNRTTRWFHSGPLEVRGQEVDLS